MNKVLILTLMMLSFVSEDGGLPEETITKIPGKAEGFKERKKKNTTLTNLSKIKKFKKPNQKKDFLIRNKKILTATFLAFLATIFGINHLKGKNPQQEQEKKWIEIKEYFKDKTCAEIFDTLCLEGFIQKMTPKNLLELLNIIIKREAEESQELNEIQKAIIEVLEGIEVIESYEDGCGAKLKDWISCFAYENMTKITFNKNGIVFSDLSDINKQMNITKSNKGEPINADELKKIQNLTNAIFKLKDMLLNPNSDQGKIDLTFEEINFLFGINCYDDISRKTPFEANKYIEEIERVLESNEDIIKLVREAQNDIENAIKESHILKKDNLRLNFWTDGFFLCDDFHYYKPCGGKDNNHIKNDPYGVSKPCSGLYISKICSGLYLRAISYHQKEVEVAEKETLKNTLEKICKIIRELNTKEINGKKLTDTWGELIKQIKDLLLLKTPSPNKQLSKQNQKRCKL